MESVRDAYELHMARGLRYNAYVRYIASKWISIHPNTARIWCRGDYLTR